MRRIQLILLSLLISLSAAAQNVWDTEYVRISQSIVAPVFKNKKYVITKFGASPSATASANQKSINEAIRKCNGAGGGKVVVPKGVWHTGAIRLLSNVNLVIEKDATLFFDFDPKLYPLVRTRYEGTECMNYSPLIYAYQEKNIAVTGEGTIDGNGSMETWWGLLFKKSKYGHESLAEWNLNATPIEQRIAGDDGNLRPQTLNIVECENALIEGVTLIRSPFWVIHPLLCKNLTVRGVTVDNHAPNGDGCDPESCDGVLIENCHFNTGDDCIAIKSGRNADGLRVNIPSQNIIVRNCRMTDGHGGVVLGSEISGGCRNIFVTDCEMDSPNLDRVIRIKSNPCRGGITDGVYVRNVRVGQCKESVLKINLDYSPSEQAPRLYNPIVRNVNLENVTCQKSEYGVMVVALDSVTNVYDVNLKNCTLNGVTSDGNYFKGSTRDINYDNCTINGRPMSHADDVTLFPQDGAKKVNTDAHLVLTFSSVPTLGKNRKIRIYDAESNCCIDSLDLSIPAGPTESRTYAPECTYTKVPYSYARTSMPTNRTVKPGTPSGKAEPTPADYQLNIIGGFTDAFHFYPVIIRGNRAIVYPHNNMLDNGHHYYATIDDGAIIAPDFQGVKRWDFETKRAMALRDTLVVDASGRGDFSTLQGALDFIPDHSMQHITVMVKAGDYEEIVYVRNKSNVTIIGEGMDNTRIHYANNEVFNPHPLTLKTNEWPGTFPSRRAAVMFDNCSDITLKNLACATDFKGQAEGLLLNGERIALYGVRIIGDGDAIQANGTIYMEGCEVIGGGDTFLGRGSVFAYRCKLINHGGPFSWVRNTKGNHGDVFVECSFDTDNGEMADFGRTVTNKGTNYPDAEFVVIDCLLGNIAPEGWSNIGMKTATMLEYNSRSLNNPSEKIDVTKRHKWSRQLSMEKDEKLISNYRNPAYILKGWNPKIDQ